MTASATPVPADPSPAPLVALGGAVFALVTALVTALEPDASPRAAVTVAGLTACAVLLLHPRVFRGLRAWEPQRLAWAVAGLTLWTLVLPAERFDPYMLTIVLVSTVACAHACGQLNGRLTAVAVLVWVCLWLPLDLRWYRWMNRSSPGFFLGTALTYNTWALFTACLGVLTFGAAGRFDVGIQRASLKGPLLALGIGLLFGAIAIPVGMATGFLELKDDAPPPAVEAPANPGAEAEAPAETPTLETARAAALQLAVFFVIALTIAFPEELFFRGVLDRGLCQRWKRPWLALLVSSLLFGLMHWNNRSDPTEQWVYFGLASLAGVAYALAFRKGGLLSAIFLHALVDWVWQLEFAK